MSAQAQEQQAPQGGYGFDASPDREGHPDAAAGLEPVEDDD